MSKRTIIPAAPGTVLHVVELAETVRRVAYHMRYPVIGWRIGRGNRRKPLLPHPAMTVEVGGALGVHPGNLGAGLAIEIPDFGLYEVTTLDGCRVFDNFAEWVEYLSRPKAASTAGEA